MKLIELNIHKIFELCRRHKVKQLFVFGSILTDRFNDQSDVDLAVVFEPISHEDYADNYFDLYHAFESLFNRAIDLVEYDAVKNRFFKQELDETKQLIYG